MRLFLLLLAVCAAAQDVQRPGFSRIEHLIFVEHPSRSFDDLFGTYPNVDAAAELARHDHTDAQNFHEYARLYVIQDRFFSEPIDLSALRARLTSAGITWATPDDAAFDDASREGRLPAVTWLTVPPGDLGGQIAWTTARLNALMRSRSWWRSAAFLTWPDAGTATDHVPPPEGLGARVPSVVIGPYARSTFHDHRTYTSASLIGTIEARFALERTANAPDLYDAFDFDQAAREPVILEHGGRPWPPLFQEQQYGSSWLANVHSCYGTWTLAPGTLVDGYLRGMRGEATVTVTDSIGVERIARAIYTGADQVNYMIPEDTAEGIATVSVRGDVRRFTGTAIVARLSPGLYSTTQMGQGPAPAWLRRGDDMTPAFQCTQPGVCESLPVNSQAGDLLVLYGSGFRLRRRLDDVRVFIGLTEVSPVYAGPDPAYASVDRIELEVPRTATGAQYVWISVEGLRSNAVQVLFR